MYMHTMGALNRLLYLINITCTTSNRKLMKNSLRYTLEQCTICYIYMKCKTYDTIIFMNILYLYIPDLEQSSEDIEKTFLKIIFHVTTKDRCPLYHYSDIILYYDKYLYIPCTHSHTLHTKDNLFN